MFWSGKAKQLKLEAARPSGWDEVAVAEQDDDGLPGFVDGLKALLKQSDEA